MLLASHVLFNFLHSGMSPASAHRIFRFSCFINYFSTRTPALSPASAHMIFGCSCFFIVFPTHTPAVSPASAHWNVAVLFRDLRVRREAPRSGWICARVATEVVGVLQRRVWEERRVGELVRVRGLRVPALTRTLRPRHAHRARVLDTGSRPLATGRR